MSSTSNRAAVTTSKAKAKTTGIGHFIPQLNRKENKEIPIAIPNQSFSSKQNPFCALITHKTLAGIGSGITTGGGNAQ